MSVAFLIGATGNVGAHLLEELGPDREAGTLHLRVAARSEAAAAKVRAAGAEPVSFDLERPAEFDAALAGSDTVFLLRPYSIRQLIQGKQTIDAARRVGVTHLVVVGAHGRPDTPYPIIGWNFLVEAWAERSGLGWTHVRPNFFMENILIQRDGARGTIANRIAAPVSWVASADIAAVSAAIVRNPTAHRGQAYSIATDARSVEDIAALFTEITGRPHRVEPPSRETMLERLVRGGREPVYAEPLVDYADAINAGLVPEAAATFDTVERIGGRPGMTWERFIRQRVAA